MDDECFRNCFYLENIEITGPTRLGNDVFSEGTETRIFIDSAADVKIPESINNQKLTIYTNASSFPSSWGRNSTEYFKKIYYNVSLNQFDAKKNQLLVSPKSFTRTYTGSTFVPSIKVKNGFGTVLYKNEDYRLSSATGLKNVGKHSVKVSGINGYRGTEYITFTINPKGTSITTLSPGSKNFTVKWKKRTTQTTGYQIRYSTKSSMASAKTVTVSKTGTTSKKISKLKAKKKYYVQIRTYKTVSGKKYYSAWSKKKTVKTK